MSDKTNRIRNGEVTAAETPQQLPKPPKPNNIKNSNGNNKLKRKLMSLSHGQELDQLADLAFDWLLTLE